MMGDTIRCSKCHTGIVNNVQRTAVLQNIMFTRYLLHTYCSRSTWFALEIYGLLHEYIVFSKIHGLH